MDEWLEIIYKSQKGLKCRWGIGEGEVSEGFDIGGIRSRAFDSEDYTIQADLVLLDSALVTVKEDSMLDQCLHELYQDSVMLLGHLVLDICLIMYHNDAGEEVCHLVYMHLEGIL